MPIIRLFLPFVTIILLPTMRKYSILGSTMSYSIYSIIKENGIMYKKSIFSQKPKLSIDISKAIAHHVLI